MGIVADFVAAYVNGLGFGKYFRQFIQHIIDHLLGFGLSYVDRGTGSALGVIVLFDHIGIEVFQFRVLVPVADGIEDGDDLDVIILCVFDQFFPLFLLNGVGELTGFGILFKLKSILHVGHIDVALDVGHSPDNILEVLQCGDLASGNVIGNATQRHGGPVFDLQQADLAVIQLEQLGQGHQGVVGAVGSGGGDPDTVAGNVELVFFCFKRIAKDELHLEITGAAKNFISLFDILPELLRQIQIILVNDRVFVCDADLGGDRYQIKVHHMVLLKVENMSWRRLPGSFEILVS